MNIKKSVWSYIKIFLWFIALFVIVFYLDKHRLILEKIFASIDLNFRTYLLLLFFVVSYTIFLFFFSFAFKKILESKKYYISIFQSIVVNIKSMLWGNIPGGIWNHVGYFTFSKEEIERNDPQLQISNKKLALSPVQNLVFSVFAIVLLSLFSFFILLFKEDKIQIKIILKFFLEWQIVFFILLTMLIIIVFFGFYFFFFQKKHKRRLLELIKQGSQQFFLEKKQFVLVISLYFVSVVFLTLSFSSLYLLFSPTTSLLRIVDPSLFFAYTTSWLVGFLILPVPSGLGVREWVFGYLLQNSFPIAVGFSIMLIHRVFIILMQITLFLIFWLWQKLSSRKTKSQTS